MSEFLRALGYNPWCYWPFFCAAVILWIISAGWPYRADGTPLQRLNAPFCFGATLLLAMFAGRWPAIWHYRPVNPDECQFLAGALTMVARTEFWWIDGTTSGPLVIAPLTLPGLLGLPIDFVTGRLVGLLLNWGTVFLSYLALRHIHGDRAARLLVLPLACFNVLLIFWDFTSYSSEQSPVFLCALAVMFCVTAFQPDGGLGSRGRLAAGGFILGLLPFSKFQVLPLGAGVGLATLVWIWRQPAADHKKIVRDLLCFVGAVVAGFGGMLASLRLSGHWSDFYEAYVVHNLHYTQARIAPWTSSGHILNYLTDYSWGFSSLHYGLIALLIVSLGGIRAASWRPLLLGWVLLIAAYGAVLTPGRFYPHYLLFLSFPLSLLAGLQFGSLVAHRTGRTRTILWIFFLLLGAGIQVADRLSDRQSLLALLPIPSVRANAVNFINHVKQPGDSLAVWGWRSELYVETQLPQATREAHTEAQVSDHPQRDYYRARFLADMRANQPAFFIDVVGPEDFNLHDLPRQGHENFADLKDYIDREYTLVSKNQPVRVYVRRTLMHN